MTNTPQAPIADTAPADMQITDYDSSHLTNVSSPARRRRREPHGMRLHESCSASIPPGTRRSRRIYDLHLARARWISDHGYRDLASHLALTADRIYLSGSGTSSAFRRDGIYIAKLFARFRLELPRNYAIFKPRYDQPRSGQAY